MAPLAQFQPHRQTLPRRLCIACDAVLCSSNATSTCWSCENGWTEPQEDRLLTKAEKEMLMDAVNEILQTEA